MTKDGLTKCDLLHILKETISKSQIQLSPELANLYLMAQPSRTRTALQHGVLDLLRGFQGIDKILGMIPWNSK
jgi:hypothetical protein